MLFRSAEELEQKGIGEQQMVDSTMSPDPKLRRESRVRCIYSSLAIEQNTLSLDQVTAVIDGKRILGPPKDIQEVKNASEAYEHMSSYDPYSMEDLLTVHRYIDEGTGTGSRMLP